MTSRIADARAIYEGTHQLTMAELAEVTGIPKRVLSSHARAESWAKQVKQGQSDEARQAVERFAEWRALAAEVAAAPPAGASDAVPDLARPMVEDALSKLLERHKQELMAPRAISAEAIKIRNSDPDGAFQKAKLAKITAETLDLLHRAERRAWGIDDRETPQGSVIVIDRGAND